MSIPFADATTTILPHQTPSPPGVEQPASPFITAALLTWLLLALLLAQIFGAFKRDSIAGPDRLGPEGSAWRLLFIFFTGYFGANVLLWRFQARLTPNNDFRLLVLTSIMDGGAIPLIVLAGAIARGDPIRRLGLRMHQILRGISTGTITLFILYPMVLLAGDLTDFTFQRLHFKRPSPHEVLQTLTQSHDKHLIALALFVAIIVAPAFEELAFRGFFQTIFSRFFAWLNDFSNAPVEDFGSAADQTIVDFSPKPPLVPGPGARWSAVVVTSILFAAVHGELAFMPPLFILSLGFGYLYERTGNLWSTFIAHSLFNVCQIVFYLSLAT